MSPSCRVRRGATFPSRLLEDVERQYRNPDTPEHDLRNQASGAQRQSSFPTSRARSRTLASIFSESTGGQRSSDPRLRETFPIPAQRQLSPSDERGAQFLPDAADHPASPRVHDVVVHDSPTGSPIQNECQPGVMESFMGNFRPDEDQHHEDEVVEHLEVIDPQVSAVSHLSNATNSIIIPPMSSLYSRRPVIDLPRPHSANSHEKGGHEHIDELDIHVEHLLRERDPLKRTAAGVWSYVKTPMGIITVVYGFCVVFWGAAIVFFLAGWIPTSSKDRKGFWVEVSSQIENALFTVTGVGLIPWRALDTYRILHIWNYKRITRKLRNKAGLPELYDEDDLPDPIFDLNYVHVLTDEQQRDLHHQQKELAKSQTWYRPHGTASHRAFPIEMALLICLFVDGNSFFQVILCGCMWGLDRFRRPAWTIGTLIPASFMCGIIAAILIWKGGQKTKRTKVVEARLRAALSDQNATDVPAAIVTVPVHQCANPQDNTATATRPSISGPV